MNDMSKAPMDEKIVITDEGTSFHSRAVSNEKKGAVWMLYAV